MLLPVILPDNSIGTQTFNETDYFNPITNPNYDTDYTSNDAANGKISIRNTIKFSKALLDLNPISELTNSIAFTWGGSVGSNIWNTLSQVFLDALPDHAKFLIFSTTFGSVRDLSDDRHKWNAKVVYIDHTAYGEATRGHVMLEFTTNFVNGVVSVTPDQHEAIKDLIAPHIAEIYTHYETRLESTIYYNDSMVPRIVQMMYKFSHNKELYYPSAPRDRYVLVPANWHIPSGMAVHLAAQLPITLTMSPQMDRIHFKEGTITAGDRRYLNRVLPYSTNVLEHLPYTIKGPKEPAATLYGVELEANSDYTPTQVMEAQKDLFFCLKQDSSIHGSKAQNYEMVTVPCTMRAHKRLWAEFFTKIDYTKFDTSKQTGNGMHVHVDRQAFSSKHLNKFTWFFINPVNREFLFLISERPTKTDMERWAPFPILPARKSLNYCSRMGVHINGRIRGAINFKGTKTVEVRLFKGIASYATIVKNVEFVDSVVEYTRHTEALQVSLFGYLNWLQATPKNRYEMLKAFLAEIDQTKFLTVAQVDHVTWGIHDDPEKVADKLNAAPFKVTTAHLSVLNKRRKKKIYVLTDGVVRTLEKNPNKGVLSKLDLLAQQKQTRGASSFSVYSL